MFVIPVLAVAMFSSCLYKGIKKEQTYQEEMILLTKYIRELEKTYDVDTTELGVFYYVREWGSGGPYPEIGDTLIMSYNGYLIDGTPFYSSSAVTANGEVSFVLGSEAIEGWNDGLKVIRKGSKVDLIIPSPLGFGSKWNGDIPPNNTLVYVITMVDIKQKK